MRKIAYLGEDSDGEADGVMILAPTEERPALPFYFQSHSPLFSWFFLCLPILLESGDKDKAGFSFLYFMPSILLLYSSPLLLPTVSFFFCALFLLSAFCLVSSPLLKLPSGSPIVFVSSFLAFFSFVFSSNNSSTCWKWSFWSCHQWRRHLFSSFFSGPIPVLLGLFFFLMLQG